MKHRWNMTLAAALAIAAAGITPGHAAEEGIDKARPASSTSGCSQAPRSEGLCLLRAPLRCRSPCATSHQKVSAMKLLVTAEMSEERNRRITNIPPRRDISASSAAITTPAAAAATSVPEDSRDEIHLGCGVDCDGGGINIGDGQGRQIGARAAGARAHLAEQQAGRERATNWSPARTTRFPARPHRASTNAASLVTDRKELARCSGQQAHRLLEQLA